MENVIYKNGTSGKINEDKLNIFYDDTKNVWVGTFGNQSFHYHSNTLMEID